MKSLTLQFQSFSDLLTFTLVTEIKLFEFDGSALLLFCQLSEAQLELAKAGFEALVV